MNITTLTVVNACLASMGEEPINSIASTDNAFVNSALFALEQAVTDEQSRGWYFNIEQLRLLPDVGDKNYYVPADVIDLHDDDNKPSWMHLRGRRLYNNDDAAYVTGTNELRVSIIRLLAFEDLPIMARRLVKAAAVALFQRSYDGDSAKIADADREYQMAYVSLNAQHIRAVGANLLPSRGARHTKYRRLETPR